MSCNDIKTLKKNKFSTSNTLQNVPSEILKKTMDGSKSYSLENKLLFQQ